jgi:hypothetical protein
VVAVSLKNIPLELANAQNKTRLALELLEKVT